MNYKNVVIQKIKINTSAYTAVTSVADNEDGIIPVWNPTDKEKIEKENVDKFIYLYMFYGEDEKISEIYICRCKKSNQNYNIKVECKLRDENKINYLLDTFNISPNRDYDSYEYLMIADDIGLYNRACDFIYYGYYHNTKPGDKRMYENYCTYDEVSLILNSKSFRRLENKAQIFSSMKGDHYRNRLTHTLDVMNVALTIARKIKLSDEDIEKVEAIALGHDIGHTPFGHQGERTLNNIIKGAEDIITNAGDKLHTDMGGFKHNIQSVRILVKLENIKREYKGLNLSYEVLEGILKHSKFNRCDAENILPREYKELLHIDNSENSYISGKIVAIADELSQRCADIEDAIRSGKIDVISFMKKIDKDDFTDIKDLFNDSNSIDIPVVDEIGLNISTIQNLIKTFFIANLVANYTNSQNLEYDSRATRLDNIIKKIIDVKVINSEEVCNFDNKGIIIVKGLFGLYYNNPKLLNDNTIRNIYLDMMDNDICWKKTPNDFRNMDNDFINREMEAIHSLKVEDSKMIIVDSDLSNACGGIECVYEKQKILIRNICDYIAGMTDEFAQKEYKQKVLALSID